MFIIGITGGTGAGKTSALRSLESLGALTLDCDSIYHELLANSSDLKKELEQRFSDVLLDGVINRQILGQIVFNDPAALKDLNAITHKYITEAVMTQISMWRLKKGTVVAIDAIALIESKIADICNIIIGISAPKENRISRIMERDEISYESAILRVNAQKPDSYYRDNCDLLLENIYETAEEFEEKCIEFFRELVHRFQNSEGY